jgi:hypothetical protein
MSMVVIFSQGNGVTFQQVAVPVKITAGYYRSQSNGVSDFDRYPQATSGQSNFIKLAQPFPIKLLFLNLGNVTYPVGRVNNLVTNFELHHIPRFC